MANYLVTWQIDVEDVDSHHAAALKALAIQRKPDSIATVFDVKDKDDEHAPTVQIDLTPWESGEEAPAGWLFAETSAPDDPTQQLGDVRFLTLNLLASIHLNLGHDHFPIQDLARKLAAALDAEQTPKQPTPTPAAQAVEQHIADAQQDLPLPELLAAILRRAERAKSYGRIMLGTKDGCIDDVIRLAMRALLLANDQRSAQP
jgi:hypothetical protein